MQPVLQPGGCVEKAAMAGSLDLYIDLQCIRVFLVLVYSSKFSFSNRFENSFISSCKFNSISCKFNWSDWAVFLTSPVFVLTLCPLCILKQ